MVSHDERKDNLLRFMNSILPSKFDFCKFLMNWTELELKLFFLPQTMLDFLPLTTQ